MLGFTSTRKPVSGEIAKAIREQLARIELSKIFLHCILPLTPHTCNEMKYKE